MTVCNVRPARIRSCLVSKLAEGVGGPGLRGREGGGGDESESPCQPWGISYTPRVQLF